MKEKWFEIKDLHEFVDSTRKMVFHFFGKMNIQEVDSLLKEIYEMKEEELTELDSTLSFHECLIITKNHLKREQGAIEDSYYISDSLFATIVEEINSRLVSNILSNLVNKGLIETAFDEEANDFVFWKPSDTNDKDAE